MPRKHRLGYDSACLDLAEYFLCDIDKSQYDDDIEEQLAMHLQKEIEDWLDYDLPRFKKKENEK